MTTDARLTGGQIVARTLRELGTTTIFSVSGNQILPIFDAAREFGIRIIHMRHEAAAAYAALAYAESTNSPGVVVVSAGPGFLAAAVGVATAKSAELPLLFLSGACSTADTGAGGFQDLDQASVTRVTCKTSLAVAAHTDLDHVLRRAWQLTGDDVPGPVHVGLPSDVLRSSAGGHVKEANDVAGGSKTPDAESTLTAMAERLISARRPLIIARPSANRGAAGRSLWRLARQLGIEPLIAECPRGMSDLKYREIVRHYPDSDCALVVAPADFAVGFLSDSVIASGGDLLHIDAPGDPRPQRVPDLHLRLSPATALTYLADATNGHCPHLGQWADLWSHQPVDEIHEASSAALHPLDVAEHVRPLLRPDDVIVLDGGEYCQWIRLALRDLPNPTFWNSKLGGIGGSIPMGLGLSTASHQRTIVFVGDGAFGYHCGEFETAVRYSLPIVVIVGNDARWGAEWHMQANLYGENRTYETTLLQAGYEQVARGLGAAGFHVTDTPSLRAALATALSCGQPACVNVEMQSVRSPAVVH